MTAVATPLVRSPTMRWTGMPSTGIRPTRIVRRLQARIVKATQEGRWGKVKPCNVCSPTRFPPKCWRSNE